MSNDPNHPIVTISIERRSDGYYVVATADRALNGQFEVGPCASEAEARRAAHDFEEMLLSLPDSARVSGTTH